MSQDLESYWAVIEPYWDAFNIHDVDEYLAGYKTLPEPVRHLICAHWCHSEVCNGGFSQLFFNSTGILAPEAVIAFRSIGMPATAKTIQAAMDKLGEPYPREREERMGEMIFIIMPGVFEGDPNAPVDPNYGTDPKYELEPGAEWQRWRKIFNSLNEEFFRLTDSENGGFEASASAYARQAE